MNDLYSSNGISVVCCCHNSERTIEATLYSLFNQELSGEINYEILLIDNGSRDKTVELAETTAQNANAHNFRIIYEEQIGLIYARMTGIKNVSQPVTLFVDDDNILSFDYISRLLSIFKQHRDVGVIGGYAEPYIQNRQIPAWFFNYQLMFACGPQADSSGKLTGMKQYLYGAGLAFRTKILRDCLLEKMPPLLTGRSGNLLLRGDDTELCYRCYLSGWNIYYDESLRLRHNIHINRITWKNACTMRRQSGMTWIILNIYTRLSLGVKPPSIWYMYGLCGYRWLRFLLNPKNIVMIPVRGSIAALGFNFLLGMTYSVIFWTRKYVESRSRIMQNFNPRPQTEQI